MIYFFTPYSFEKRLGRAYNDYIQLVPNDDDWICLVDADVMFLTPDFGHQLQEIINLYPDTGLFTCYTNRVGTLEQCWTNQISENSDIKYHKMLATQLQRERRLLVKPLKKIISGHLMLFKKSTWKHIGGFRTVGILAVDNYFSKAVLNLNMPILLMEGVYVLHYYRLLEGRVFRNHLK